MDSRSEPDVTNTRFDPQQSQLFCFIKTYILHVLDLITSYAFFTKKVILNRVARRPHILLIRSMDLIELNEWNHKEQKRDRKTHHGQMFLVKIYENNNIFKCIYK